MNRFVQKMTEARRMALDNVGPIRMRLQYDDLGADFESCENGCFKGQALCGEDLNLFFDVEEAKAIDVIPKRRPAKNRVKIEAYGTCHLLIDGEKWVLYMRTVKVAEHWIYKGYNYVQIEVVE